jgi:hypothetical protein
MGMEYETFEHNQRYQILDCRINKNGVAEKRVARAYYESDSDEGVILKTDYKNAWWEPITNRERA